MLSTILKVPSKIGPVFSAIILYAIVYFFASLIGIEAFAQEPQPMLSASSNEAPSIALILGIGSTILTILLSIVAFFLQRTLNQIEKKLEGLDKKADDTKESISDLKASIRLHDFRITNLEK